MGCEQEGCDHPLFMDLPTCACHIPMDAYSMLGPETQVAAIAQAARENESFITNEDGDIQLDE